MEMEGTTETSEEDAMDHGLLRLSARVVVPLTVRWDTAKGTRVGADAAERDQRLQEVLAVLRGVLRAHIAPTGGLDVAGAADAWCFVNAGDGRRFYYRFVEAPRFRVYTRAPEGGTEADTVYAACTVAARELVVLMTDDREPRDLSDPSGNTGAVNVISRYFGLSFLSLSLKGGCLDLTFGTQFRTKTRMVAMVGNGRRRQECWSTRVGRSGSGELCE